MKLLLAPHNDDEVLFCAYTILRVKPKVVIVTDCNRRISNGVTPEQRREESIRALAILGVAPEFLNIKDDELVCGDLINRLKEFHPRIVFAPAIQGGNPDHDIVGLAAKQLWGDKLVCYSTYTKDSLEPSGDIELIPTNEERKKKEHALLKYESQILHNKPHFDAVSGKSEYFMRSWK